MTCWERQYEPVCIKCSISGDVINMKEQDGDSRQRPVVGWHAARFMPNMHVWEQKIISIALHDWKNIVLSDID